MVNQAILSLLIWHVMLPHYIKRISAAIYKHTEFESRLRKSKKRDKAKQKKMSAENLINTVGLNVQMINLYIY